MDIIAYLQDLTYVVTRVQPKSIRIFLPRVLKRSATEYGRLYRGLEAKSVEALKAERRGQKPKGITRSGEAMRYNRLKEGLENLLFHVDLSSMKSKVLKRDHDLRRTMLMISALRPLGAFTAVRILAERALPAARELESTVVLIELLSELRMQAAYDASASKYHRLNAEVEALVTRYGYENYASSVEGWIAMNLAGSGDDHPELAPEADERASKLRQMYLEQPSFVLGKAALDTSIKAAQMRREHRNSLKLCTEQLAMYSEYPLLAGLGDIVRTKLTMASLSMHTGELVVAESILDDVRSELPEGHSLWFHFKDTEFFLRTLQEQFEAGQKILDEVTSQPRFGALEAVTQARWELFEFLNRYQRKEPLIVRGKDPFEDDRKMQNFRRDPGGYNVTRLILQMLVKLREGDPADVNQLTDKLKEYRNRKLRKETHPQTVAMLNFLIDCAKHKLELEAVMRGPYPALQRVLKAEAPDNALEGFLPVSYAQLAEMIVESIRNLAPGAMDKPIDPRREPATET